MMGQAIVPKQYHPVANNLIPDELRQFMDGYRVSIGERVEKFPMHHEFLNSYCPTEIWKVNK